MAKFKVLREIFYDGQTRGVGATFDAPEDDKNMRILQKLGRIERATEEKQPRRRPAAQTQESAPQTGSYERRDMQARDVAESPKVSSNVEQTKDAAD